jgi:ABC-type oligopeptide transport system substrate-binding subunit
MERVWTFELDSEARWSDGEPIVAADFVAGWRARSIRPPPRRRLACST